MSDLEDGLGDLFGDSIDHVAPEKPHTYYQYRLLNGKEIEVRLIGSSPLWGHLVWNAGHTIAKFLEENKQQYVQGKCILEFGAGAGLPSIIAAHHDAMVVVITDYPDADLIENLRFNVKTCCTDGVNGIVAVEGFLWGNDVVILKSHIPESRRDQGFDILILADLLFNHSEHDKLVRSITQTLKKDSSSCALVFFTPYRPWLLDKDMDFFRIAKEHRLRVDKIMEHVVDKVMFEEDPGSELLRRTVFGYKLTWELKE